MHGERQRVLELSGDDSPALWRSRASRAARLQGTTYSECSALARAARREALPTASPTPPPPPH